MLYTLKVRALRSPFGIKLWRYYLKLRKKSLLCPDTLSNLIKIYAPHCAYLAIDNDQEVAQNFADIAQQVGAIKVQTANSFKPTLNTPAQEFNLVSFTSGLHLLPNPLGTLVALRRLCKDYFILKTVVVPEVTGVMQSAVFWPRLSKKERKLWSFNSFETDGQPSINSPFDYRYPKNQWYWGLSPSCSRALLQLAGFEVVENYVHPFMEIFVCRAVPNYLELDEI